jgi:hypothetical protein
LIAFVKELVTPKIADKGIMMLVIVFHIGITYEQKELPEYFGMQNNL